MALIECTGSNLRLGSKDDRLELRSPRLLLRRLRLEDAPAIVAYRSLPEVARFQSWESFGLEDATRLVAEQLNLTPNTPGKWLQLAVALADTQAMIGDCGIHFLEDARQVELGITLFSRAPRPRPGCGGVGQRARICVRFAPEAPRVGSHRR